MKKNAVAALAASALAASLSISALAPMALADDLGFDGVPAPVVVPESVVVPEPVDFESDGIDYGFDYDLLAPCVPYFDLTPCGGFAPDFLYAPPTPT